jgi:AcrR family transcriptional regulator
MRRRRRTQVERTLETRHKLLDATIDCLYQLGYANTTTTEIAKRAKLSRGAQLHHFPTKIELVTTAVQHLFEVREREFRAAFADIAKADRPRATVDLLWRMISGPIFYAWLEVLVAGRTDKTLRAAVKRVTQKFREMVQRSFRELFPPTLPDAAPAFTFALLEGLALERIVGGSPLERDVLDRFKALAHMVVGG